MKKTTLLLSIILYFILCSGIMTYSQENNFAKLQFLIGEWVGTGGGSNSGMGEGVSTFRYDIDSNLIIRENYSHYPAQGNKPEYTHKDLMIIYFESGSAKAIYFDNEKHVINYDIGFAENKVIFTGKETNGTPQFRLTYQRTESNKMKLFFEIAPPNNPGKFANYITAEMQRK